jgi:hypothetical protein
MAVKRRTGAPARGPLAERILAQREVGGAEVSLERLEADFADASRYDIVASLKELEKAGRGQFVVGRKGQRSRFIWGETKAAAPARIAKKVRAQRGSAPLANGARAAEAPALSSEPAPKGSTRKALTPVGKPLARPKLSAGEAPGAPAAPRAERAARGSSRTLRHSFHLRPGLLVNLELPEDVTATEVDRFCSFLKAIPFGGEGVR